MDEATLRSMLPSGFGKQASKRKAPVADKPKAETPELTTLQQPSPGPSQSSSLANRILTSRKGKEPADVPSVQEPEYANDGLTQEEREANERLAQASDDDDSDDENNLGPEPEDATLQLPISHEAVLRDHSKTVSALDVDPSGTRIATGSYDHDVKLWDFGGMTSTLRPFVSWEPSASHGIRDLKWSPQGEMLLVIPSTPQAQVYTRDGGNPLTYKKGDVYIRDMRRTSGHVSEMTCGQWHPRDRGIFLTASTDSSIRLWDVDHVLEQHTVIVVKSKQRGSRTQVTQAAYSPDAKHIAATCTDGALYLWSTGSNFARPTATVEGAHQVGSWTSGLVWSADNRTLATRGGEGDNTVKLWDVRSFKKPLAVAHDLPSVHQETNIIFSPDERSLLTGSVGLNLGQINVLNRADLSVRERITVGDGLNPALGKNGGTGSVVRLQWHPKINQLFASSSQGSVHVYYDPDISSRGALLAIGRASKRRKNVEDFISEGLHDGVPDANGDVLVGSSELQVTGWSMASKKRKLDKLRKDPVATQMPERPMSGPGRGGRIGAAATQHVAQNIYKDNSREEDPREALLKYADKVQGEGPKFTSAWQETQPTPIFSKIDYASSGEEADDDDDRA